MHLVASFSTRCPSFLNAEYKHQRSMPKLLGMEYADFCKIVLSKQYIEKFN